MYDIAIIGAGPAGLTAAVYSCRYGKSTIVFEGASAGGQIVSTHLMENYPGFAEGIGGADFAIALRAQAQRFGADIVGAAAEKAELAGDIKRIYAGGAVYEARAVILAMGASPRTLGIEGEAEYTGSGVSYCATCDGAFFRGGTVCVIGGGDTALEDALFLSGLAKKVYVIHRRDAFRAQSRLVERASEKDNIEFILNAVPKAIKGGVLGLNAIDIEDTATGAVRAIDIDGCFVAVGQEPQTALAEGQIETEHGYIPAGEDTHTDIAGVFAAGDIRTKRLRQVVTAAADGAVAAYEAFAYLEN